jgi:hypothetical protein
MLADLCFPIDANTVRCAAVRSHGFVRFEELAGHVRALPYGRITADADFLEVLTQGRGTCSSKHRLLAAVAHDCGHREVRLTVGIYLMSDANTPGVAAALQTAGLAEIPEAHCYLSLGAARADFTGLPSGPQSPFDALVAEYDVAPADLASRKPSLHRAFMTAWAQARGIDPRRVWAAREACIAALAAKPAMQCAPEHGPSPP